MAFRPVSILHKVEFSTKMYGGLDKYGPPIEMAQIRK